MFGPASGNTGEICPVCSDPTSADASAICAGCGASYHLILDMKVGGKDCGTVMLDDDSCSMQFLCTICITEAGGMPGLDPGAELGFPSRESLATLTASETTDGAQQTQNGGRVKQAVTSVRDSIRRRLS